MPAIFFLSFEAFFSRFLMLSNCYFCLNRRTMWKVTTLCHWSQNPTSALQWSNGIRIFTWRLMMTYLSTLVSTCAFHLHHSVFWASILVHALRRQFVPFSYFWLSNVVLDLSRSNNAYVLFVYKLKSSVVLGLGHMSRYVRYHLGQIQGHTSCLFGLLEIWWSCEWFVSQLQAYLVKLVLKIFCLIPCSKNYA